MKEKELEYFIFIVDDTPFCLWGFDLRKQNLEFINSINPSYFQYLAKTHFQNLKSENEKEAATALRYTFYHVLETFFTFLCATVQAPYCVVGWVQKSKPSQIRKIIKAIKEQLDIPNVFDASSLTWDLIVKEVFPDELQMPKDQLQEVRSKFSRFWDSMAMELLELTQIIEHNSIKHGFRIKEGGFSISIGDGGKGGVPFTEKIQTLSGSRFGNSFLSAEAVENSPVSKKKDSHFAFRETSINWDPEATFYKIILLSISLQSLIVYLKHIHQGNSKIFVIPKDMDLFEKCHSSENIMIKQLTYALQIQEDCIKRFDKEEMEEHLKKRKILK